MILKDTGYEFGSLKKTRAAVIAGSKGCFLPGLSDWLNVRLEECIFVFLKRDEKSFRLALASFEK